MSDIIIAHLFGFCLFKRTKLNFFEHLFWDFAINYLVILLFHIIGPINRTFNIAKNIF